MNSNHLKEIMRLRQILFMVCALFQMTEWQPSAWSQSPPAEPDPFSAAAPPDLNRNRNRPEEAPSAVRDPSDRSPSSASGTIDVPADTPATLDGGATLNPVLTKNVQDNTIGLLYEERPAYFYGLWLASQLQPTELTQLALRYRDERQQQNPRFARRPRSEFPQFVDIFQNPEAYRGRAVTLTGYLRSLKKFDPGPNDLGIAEVYEGSLFTEDSQSNPGIVVFTQKPEGLKLGADITEEVRFSGYFLKMYGYQAGDGMRKAPLFLAGSVQWYPARAANERTPVPAWLYGALTMVAIISVWLLWTTFQRQKASRSRFETGRNFDEYPPQEFLGPHDPSQIEPHH